MTQWSTKRAGLLYDAVTTYVATSGEAECHPQLAKVLRLAGEASSTAVTSEYELNAIHFELCAYCIGKNLFNCAGHQHQPECAFIESALETRISQFNPQVS